MRTTIRLGDALLREAKWEAARCGMTLTLVCAIGRLPAGTTYAVGFAEVK